MWLPIAIIAIVFSFVLMIIKMSQDHETQKLRLTKGSDKSLTVSELNEMVAEAVEEAIEPLKERIRELEGKKPVRDTAPPSLEESSRRLDLEELDMNDSADEVLSRTRKKVR